MTWLSQLRTWWAGPPGAVMAEAERRGGEIAEALANEAAESRALALSAVWGCVNLLSGVQASMPLRVLRAGPKGAASASEHPLYALIHDSPNADQTAFDFWSMVTTQLELRGNAYARKLFSGARLVALEPIESEVTTRRAASGAIEYAWTAQGRSYRLGERDVLHLRGPFGGPLGGLSTLSAARRALSIAGSADMAAAAMFRNGLRPSGLLTFEKFLTAEQRAISETRLVERFSGAMNAGRPMLLEGGAKWHQAAITPEDAQMLETRGFSVEEICRFFGVPPFMIGHTEKQTSWGSGVEQQTIGFVRYTLRPRLVRIEQAIDKQLLTPADRAAGLSVEFNLEGLLRGDSKSRAAYYREMTMIGAMTINEVRALENLPPVPGGDVPRMQAQNVPIGAAPTLDEQDAPG